MTESAESQSHRYRFDTVKEFSTNLNLLSSRYREKIKKYQRRITAIDVTVYSISGVMASAGVILSTVTMMAPIAVPIAISAATTIAGVATAITKKLSSCSQKKLSDVTARYRVVFDAYSKLSELISLLLDNSVISDVEFSTMTQLYNSAMLKLEIENNINNNVTETRRASTTSTNRGEYHSDTNKHDINNINEPTI